MMGLSKISLGAENKEEPVMFLLLGVKVSERERAVVYMCVSGCDDFPLASRGQLSL